MEVVCSALKARRSNHSLGQPPQVSGSKIRQTLKARFSAHRHCSIEGSDATPARLQRAYSACSFGNCNSWGDTPG